MTQDGTSALQQLCSPNPQGKWERQRWHLHLGSRLAADDRQGQRCTPSASGARRRSAFLQCTDAARSCWKCITPDALAEETEPVGQLKSSGIGGGFNSNRQRWMQAFAMGAGQWAHRAGCWLVWRI